MLQIKDIGISVDTLTLLKSENYEILRGNATIYSSENNEEYEDDIEFSYNIKENFVCFLFNDEVWEEFSEDLEEMLIENILTNDLINHAKKMRRSIIKKEEK